MGKKGGGIVVGRFFGRMIGHDTQRLSRALQAAIAREGRVRLLLAVEALGGGESLMEGLHFVRLHADHIDRIAVLGDRAALQTQIGLFGLFGGVDIACFDRHQINEAVRWLEEA
jgi:hypothetical protein